MGKTKLNNTVILYFRLKDNNPKAKHGMLILYACRKWRDVVVTADMS